MTSTSPRRSTVEDAAGRHALLAAAERLMLREGHAAVTARRVAAEAGLKPQLVHYYFVSMDDLFVSVIRRGAERSAELIEQARASPKPLWALWRLSNQPTVTILSAELNAAARHRSAIRKELAQAAEQFRLAQADTLAEVLQRYDVDTGDLPVRVLLLFAEGLARGMGAGSPGSVRQPSTTMPWPSSKATSGASKASRRSATERSSARLRGAVRRPARHRVKADHRT